MNRKSVITIKIRVQLTRFESQISTCINKYLDVYYVCTYHNFLIYIDMNSFSMYYIYNDHVIVYKKLLLYCALNMCQNNGVRRTFQPYSTLASPEMRQRGKHTLVMRLRDLLRHLCVYIFFLIFPGEKVPKREMAKLHSKK